MSTRTWPQGGPPFCSRLSLSFSLQNIIPLLPLRPEKSSVVQHKESHPTQASIQDPWIKPRIRHQRSSSKMPQTPPNQRVLQRIREETNRELIKIDHLHASSALMLKNEIQSEKSNGNPWLGVASNVGKAKEWRGRRDEIWKGVSTKIKFILAYKPLKIYIIKF